MRIAIVSGASSGMGREFVKLIDQRCPSIEEIWVIARHRDRLLQLQFYVKKPLRIFAMDLMEGQNLDLLSETLRQSRPSICVLAASAGYGKYAQADTLSIDDAYGMIDLNVRALTGLTQMSLPYMAGGGRIFLMSSSAAFMPQPGFGIYAATKAYVSSYAQSLHMELARRAVSVTAVCPGPVRTDFFARAAADGQIPPSKEHFAVEADKVCEKAWQDCKRGRAISVYGIPMKTAAAAARILPRTLLMKGMSLLS